MDSSLLKQLLREYDKKRSIAINNAEKRKQELLNANPKLQEIDKDTVNKLSENDTTRIKRAMEVWYHTGKNLTYWHSIPLINHFNPQDFIKIYIKPLNFN